MSEGLSQITRDRCPAACLLGMMLFIVLVTLPGTAFAQSYLVHHYTVDDGLPSSTVFDIEQDTDGMIWFATDAGIVRYDGLLWDLIGSYPEIKIRAANFLVIDKNQNAWVGSNSDDLIFQFDGETWSRIDLPITDPPIQIRSMAILLDEGLPLLAIGTEQTGLFILRREQWLHYDRETGLPGNSVGYISAVDDAFVAATDRGIVIWRQGKLDTSLNKVIPEDSQELLALNVTGTNPHEEMWLLSRNSVAVIRDGVYAALHSGIRFMPKSKRFVILKDRGDFLYYGSPRILFQMNTRTGRIRQLEKSHGLINDGAYDLHLDRENNVWIAGYRGAEKISSTFFSIYRKYHGILSNEVTALTEYAPNHFVLGHPDGLSVLTEGHITTIPFTRFEKKPWISTRVVDLHTATDGRVWIAANYGGLAVLEENHHIKWFGPKEGINGIFNSVIEDSDGTLYALEQNALFRFEAGHFVSQGWVPEQGASARRMFAGTDNKLYFATNNGFYIFDNGTISRVPGLETTRSADIFAALEDSLGRLWVGTMEGLFILKDGFLTRPEKPMPRIDRPVFFIEEDHQGDLWIGTENGVIRWTGDSLLHYTTANGLAGRETNRDAGLVDHRGRIWIGTESGVSIATKMKTDPSIPRPRIDAARISSGGIDYSFYEPLSLQHSAGSVTFHFKSISMLDEKRVSYSHRLQGLEDEWSSPASAYERMILYPHLPSGRYRFDVKACNSIGVWSETASSGWVVVLPPLWKRWWFLLMTLGGGGLITTLLAVSVLRARYASRLELEVSKRTAELKESEELYRKLFEGGYPRFLIDPKTMEFADANPAGCLLAGLPRNQLLGSIAGQTGVEWVDRLPVEIQDHLELQSSNFLITAPEEGEGLIDLEIRTQRVSIHGENRILVTAQDVTARRKLEEEQLRADKLESVGLLAGGIAHDFNNLLTAILGNLSLGRMELADGNDPGDSLKLAEEASERARRLTAQLLTFSRGGKPIKTILNLESLIRNSTEFALTGSKTRSVFEIQKDLWPVEGDEGQLDQVFSNLALNALQAMPQGGTVTITAQNLRVDKNSELPLEAGSWVKITVSDEGIGLPATSIDRIFDPYFTTKGTGNGLGLATCYSIIQKHQGLIEAANLNQDGARFTIYLPAATDVLPETATAAQLSLPDPSAGPGRILIMDDEPALQIFYDRALLSLGHEVQITGDGAQAEEAFRCAIDSGESFDLVILDLTVPGAMGGKETLARLRSMSPGILAIVASGYSNDPDMADYEQAGFQGALKKPFTVDDLSAVLDKVLKLRD